MNNEDIDKMIQHLESLRSGGNVAKKTITERTVDIVNALDGVGYNVQKIRSNGDGTRNLKIKLRVPRTNN
jgi:hypothetical protein